VRNPGYLFHDELLDVSSEAMIISVSLYRASDGLPIAASTEYSQDKGNWLQRAAHPNSFYSSG